MKSKMRTFVKRIIIISFVFSITLIFNLTDMFAAESTTLRFAQFVPPKNTFRDVEDYYANEISKRTDNKINIKYYYGQSLGKVSALLSLAGSGGVDMTMIVPGYYPAELPLSSGPNQAFFIHKTLEEALAVATSLYSEGPVNAELKKHNLKFLYSYVLTPYHLYSIKPVNSLADLKGFKIRTWGAEFPMIFEPHGAVCVQMPTPEVYEAMERGGLDGVMAMHSLAVQMGLQDVAKYVTLVGIGVVSGPIVVMNLDKWNSLPEDVKNIFEDIDSKIQPYVINSIIETDNAALKIIKEKGLQINDFPDREKLISDSPDFGKVWLNKMEKLGLKNSADEAWEQWQKVLTKHRN